MDTWPRRALHPADFEAILSHPLRASAVETAIALCRTAWSILNDELRALGYDGEAPDFEGGSAYGQYCEWDCQLLEDADAVYHCSTIDRQQQDDRDLEHFETTFEVEHHMSLRIKALALRTIARDLVATAVVLPDEQIDDAMRRVVIRKVGTVDVVKTCCRYLPFFAVERF